MADTTNKLKEYVESEAVQAAKAALEQQQALKPGAYQSQWQTSLNDAMNKILNREKFTYDLNGDALYQQYKDQYVTQGKQAMMDTIGQAAQLTGGYGNSYAQSVGQQTFQGYLQGLNDKIPELYNIARNAYDSDTAELYNQYGLFADREDQDYGRYRDQLGDWENERDFLTDRYDTERGYDYGQHRDTVGDLQWQMQFDEAIKQFLATADPAVRQYYENYGKLPEEIVPGGTGGTVIVGGSSGGSSGGSKKTSSSSSSSKSVSQLAQEVIAGKWGNGADRKEALAAAGYDAAAVQAAVNKALGGSGSGSGSGSSSSSSSSSGKSYVAGGGTKYNVEADLNTFISAGASKSEINNYLRSLKNDGAISTAEYATLKDKYAPAGYTY